MTNDDLPKEIRDKLPLICLYPPPTLTCYSCGGQRELVETPGPGNNLIDICKRCKN